MGENPPYLWTIIQLVQVDIDFVKKDNTFSEQFIICSESLIVVESKFTFLGII